MPLEQGTYTIASGFGPRWGAMHLGLDFAAADGTPIYAAQSGTVAYIGAASGFGQWIVLDHPQEAGGGTTVYGHMWDAYATGLSQGDQVVAGQLIAYVGSNGESTGPHCHFEVHPSVWAAGSQIDPQPWLAGATEPGAEAPEPTPPAREEHTVSTHFGIDIASYQAGLDMAQVAAEGFSYVIAKATEGDDYWSPFYRDQRDSARRNGLLFGAYHYVREGVSASAQVDNYTAIEPDKTIPVMLDVELGSGGIDLTREMLAEFSRRGYHVNLVYLPRWFWNGHYGRADLSGLPPLMSSNYVEGSGHASALYPGDTHEGWSGYGGNIVGVYQFSDQGQVAGYALDVNAFRGTRAGLEALFSTTQEDDLPYTPEDLKALIYECLSTYVGPIGSDVKDVREQLCGVGQRDAGQYGGWPELDNKTVVEKLAELKAPACARACPATDCPDKTTN
ncbi:peptidoglycan DD-metalloendopeptidase family protein [Nocardia sp. CA-128927]|uniref:peptidoglycan DD-metalloendopeptidase family protein n=1 Tax=Nocardia sp. CA-128927 TaxID=3239975 RepID=UPI003D970A7D